MTTQQQPESRTGASSRREDAAALSEHLPHLMRVLHAAKGRLAVGSDPDGERAAHILLFPLVRLGPLRQGTLAELMHTDPSTVSRHVALLVRRGLVQRTADEHDGRASRLLVTPAGEAAVEAMRQERASMLEQVTAGWPDDDLSRFTELLGRFVQDLDDHVPSRAGCGAPPHPEKDR